MPFGLITLLLAAAVLLGIYLGVLHLGGTRRPALAALHMLLGAVAADAVVVAVLQGPSFNRQGSIAALLLAAAVLLGLLAPLLFRAKRGGAGLVLAAHAWCGFAGGAVFLAWVAAQR